MKNLTKYFNEAIESKWQPHWSRSNSPCPKKEKILVYAFKTVTPVLCEESNIVTFNWLIVLKHKYTKTNIATATPFFWQNVQRITVIGGYKKWEKENS